MTHYHSARQRRVRFLGPSLVIGLAILSITVLAWPTKTRRAERLLTSVAESLSCEGPITQLKVTSVRDLLQTHFAEATTVQIGGPQAVDGSFSRDQLLDSYAELCTVVARFSVELSHISVDIAESGNAHVRADANIEYHLEGRTERERRQVRFNLHWVRLGYQLTSVDVLPKVVDQPEPRP